MLHNNVPPSLKLKLQWAEIRGDIHDVMYSCIFKIQNIVYRDINNIQLIDVPKAELPTLPDPAEDLLI